MPGRPGDRHDDAAPAQRTAETKAFHWIVRFVHKNTFPVMKHANGNGSNLLRWHEGSMLLRFNVRAKRATTVGNQARAGENVPCTARLGLVACHWRSA